MIPEVNQHLHTDSDAEHPLRKRIFSDFFFVVVVVVLFLDFLQGSHGDISILRQLEELSGSRTPNLG